MSLCFQVLQQSGDRFVARFGSQLVIDRKVDMLVPVAMRDFDETHTSLDEAPREQALFAEALGWAAVGSVHAQRCLALLRRVHQGGHRVLHSECQLVRFDHAFDARLILVAAQLFAIEFLDQVELCSLLLSRECWVS